MAGHNTYLTYKRETAELLYWVIQASNSIIQKTGAEDEDGLSLLNTSGKTTVYGLVSMAKLIAEHIGRQTVPPIVYRLFKSVIKAREEAHEAFKQLAAENSDPEVKKNNASHKHFIDALKEAFKALGGESETAKREADAGSLHEAQAAETNIILLANKFASLNLGTVNDEAQDDAEAASDASDGPAAAQRPQKKYSGKGKKGKRGKKPKQKQKKPVANEPPLVGVPIESYRIIEDKEGIMTDYLMATYALAREWIDLRGFMQKTWRQVAYDGLNAAVAGTLSNVAVSMLKRSELAMHLDFPGHDSFHTIMNTITRGDVEKIQGNFKLRLIKFYKAQAQTRVEEAALDVKEQLMIHTYNDLLDFVADYQKTRSGKPTKSMLAEIQNWDPTFNLQQATPEQRLKWRRSYTINWLYDLVNLFSSVVVQRNTLKGQNWALEKVDWSEDGPWSVHRRLFGLNEFAGWVTSLATQKQGTDVRNKVQPHSVFQLQCIVDSLMVSRGFSTSTFRGHVMRPPAHQFRPRRDVDLFLDRENERGGSGFLQAVDILEQLFERDAQMHGNPKRHTKHMEVLKIAQQDFIDWLGESKYGYVLKSISPSQFSNSNANGLWEYSPFLCGLGLMEGLEISYLFGMMIWDRIPEPFLLIHLHNMLVQRGYIAQPVGLYASLQSLFTDAFFIDGKVPTSNFLEALVAKVDAYNTARARATQQAARRSNAQASDVHGMLDVNANKFFKTPTTLVSYRKADWNYERVADSDIKPISMLAMLRVAQTELVVDPETGKLRPAETELTSRMRAAKLSEEILAGMSSMVRRMNNKNHEDPAMMARFAAMAEPGYMTESGGLRELSKKLKTGGQAGSESKVQHEELDLDGVDVLEFLKWDIHADVCGREPLSSLNFVWVTARFFIQFMQMEDELRKLRNPTYVRAYEVDPTLMREKRLSLAVGALRGGDEQCLRIMAEQFQNPRAGFMDHIYWKDLETELKTDKEIPRKEDDEFNDQVDTACSVM
ncbi:hypothetical protein JX265_007564 [Neoarthrinium moseri]|uniref:DUF6604 domain-containing protein n=1 Tax=Neoarthrinium moseri TaxID=1658444 RepID=A0A9P9WJV0_9PEZI|nr:hypothetical protein JX265_007564 [Neoarthrinium moseri]